MDPARKDVEEQAKYCAGSAMAGLVETVEWTPRQCIQGVLCECHCWNPPSTMACEWTASMHARRKSMTTIVFHRTQPTRSFPSPPFRK